MSYHHVPNGITAQHARITPSCRREYGGNVAAFEAAARCCLLEYLECLKGRGEDGSHYHLILVVEPPAREQQARAARRAGDRPKA